MTERAQRLLREMFAEILECERVSAEDDFFALGGNSLLVILLINKIRDVFHVDLSTKAVFENPTPATLADELAVTHRTKPALVARPRAGEQPPVR